MMFVQRSVSFVGIYVQYIYRRSVFSPFWKRMCLYFYSAGFKCIGNKYLQPHNILVLDSLIKSLLQIVVWNTLSRDNSQFRIHVENLLFILFQKPNKYIYIVFMSIYLFDLIVSRANVRMNNLFCVDTTAPNSWFIKIC